MTVLLYAVAFFASLFVGVLSALTLTAILRLRFAPPQTLCLSPLDVPADVRAQLAPGLAHLAALGFTQAAALRMSSQVVDGQAVPQHGLVLTHAEQRAAGYVLQLTTPERGRHYGIFFVSRSRAGRTLVTRNRAAVAGALPLSGYTTQDCWLPSWPALWQAHVRRMPTLVTEHTQWQQRSATAWIEAGAAAETSAFRHRRKHGDLVEAGDSSWRFGLRRALLMLGLAWLNFIPSQRAMAADAPAAGAAAATPGEAAERFVQTYERDSLSRRTGSWSNRAKWLLFFVTAAVAALSFGLNMDLGLVPALVTVLLFHELGHFAAMRWAGYRDLKVFFLPFIGAAVSGRHEHPTAQQELVVLFAGPVPGLLLGIAGLLWLPFDPPATAWLRECAALAVTINAFNLLPIHPLDGGKIFEILLLSRWPWLAFSGRVAGLLAFAGLALTAGSDTSRGVLWGLVVLMALGLAHQRREARLATVLRADGRAGGLARTDALRALFGGMQRLGLVTQPWPHQRLLADALLPTLTRARLRRSQRAGGLLVHLFFLLLPALVLVLRLWGSQPGFDSAEAARVDAARNAAPAPPPMADAAERQRQDARIDSPFAELRGRVLAQPDPGRRWALLQDEFGPALDGASSLDGARLPAAAALAQEAQRLAPDLPDAAGKRALAALWQAQLMPAGEARQAALQAVMDLYDEPAAAGADAGPLAAAAVDWLYADGAGRPARRSAVIDKALARLGPQGDGYRQQVLRGFKLDQLMAQGERSTAVALARAWLAAADARPGQRAQAAQLLVDTVLAAEGPAVALRALDETLPALDALPAEQAFLADGLRRTGMWLAEAAGRPDWQRAQAARLARPAGLQSTLPWWGRLLVWVRTGGRGVPASVTELEHAHWRGDADAARQLAETIRRQRPGLVVQLHEGSEGAGALSAARITLINSGRRAVLERYGLRVNLSR